MSSISSFSNSSFNFNALQKKWDASKSKLKEGIFLSGTSTIFVSPLIYLKNRMQVGGELKAKDCLRGVIPNCIRVIPQVSLAIFFNEMMKDGQKMPLSKEIFSASLAGGFAAILGTPIEGCVQRYQDPKSRSLFREATKTWTVAGFSGFLKGARFTIAREILFAPGYLVLSPWVYKKIKPYTSHDSVAKTVSGIFSGIVIAIPTNVPDQLRAVEQSHLDQKNLNWKQISNHINFNNFKKGLAARCALVGALIGLMDCFRSRL